MIRKGLFWLHLIAGVAAGVVILVMSVTGVLLTYERQILAWEDHAYFAVRHWALSDKRSLDSSRAQRC